MSSQLFDKHQYINLETFRKTGQGVKTPVWFVRDGDALWVWTQADSGKAKRVRHTSRVNVAPCQANGDLLGDWVAAQATRHDAPESQARVRDLMAKKYGLMFWMFALLGKVRRAQYTTLHITF